MPTNQFLNPPFVGMQLIRFLNNLQFNHFPCIIWRNTNQWTLGNLGSSFGAKVFCWSSKWEISSPKTIERLWNMLWAKSLKRRCSLRICWESFIQCLNGLFFVLDPPYRSIPDLKRAGVHQVWNKGGDGDVWVNWFGWHESVDYIKNKHLQHAGFAICPVFRALKR